MYSDNVPLFDIRRSLAGAIYQGDFEELGFAEIWAVDFSDGYYSPRDPRRPADLFCFKPAHSRICRAGAQDRKPFG